jgi:hypothetical protein
MTSASGSIRLTTAMQVAGLGLIMLLALPFVVRSGAAGLAGLRPVAWPTASAADLARALHMLAGAAITALAPLQLITPLRRRLPGLHRACGRLVVAGAAITSAAGLAFIALRGTVGGPVMDAGFALYGLCLAAAATQTYRHARARDLARHREWALRLFVLAIASWLYRVHYGLWYLATGGLWSDLSDFSGAFDRVQVFAFYLAYLAALELWFASERRLRARRAAA